MVIPSNRHPQLKGDILHNTVNHICKTGRVTKGDYVTDFEESVKSYYDVKYAISFGSGTMAHYAAAHSMKVEPNRPEKILVPAFTYQTVPWTLEIARFKPHFVDINPDTYHLNYEEDYWYEYVAFMDTYGSICDTNGHDPHLCIIDACHSFGVPRKELRGRGEVFSFNGGKLFTTGEGGMVITNDNEFANSVQIIRDNVSRMSELQASLGIEFMDCIEEILGQREQNAMYYAENLRPEFKPQDIPIATNNYMYAVRVGEHRNTFIRSLRDEIALRYYYYPPLMNLPNTMTVGKEHMILPNGVDMQEEIKDITDMLNSLMEELVE